MQFIPQKIPEIILITPKIISDKRGYFLESFRQDLLKEFLNSEINFIQDNESKEEKWNRGLDIFIESVIKPDDKLRSCAHNQSCYNELMDIRNDVLEYLKSKRWN